MQKQPEIDNKKVRSGVIKAAKRLGAENLTKGYFESGNGYAVLTFTKSDSGYTATYCVGSLMFVFGIANEELA